MLSGAEKEQTLATVDVVREHLHENLTVKEFASHGQAPLRNFTSRPVGSRGQSTSPPKPELLDQVRLALRARHHSFRTERAYIAWFKRFISFQGKRHPV